MRQVRLGLPHCLTSCHPYVTPSIFVSRSLTFFYLVISIFVFHCFSPSPSSSPRLFLFLCYLFFHFLFNSSSSVCVRERECAWAQPYPSSIVCSSLLFSKSSNICKAFRTSVVINMCNDHACVDRLLCGWLVYKPCLLTHDWWFVTSVSETDVSPLMGMLFTSSCPANNNLHVISLLLLFFFFFNRFFYSFSEESP